MKDGRVKFGKDLKTYHEIPLLYSLGKLNYIVDNKREALKWLNKIINLRTDSRQDLQAVAGMLVLIIHYEMNNDEIVPYIARSIQRYMKEKERMYPLEVYLLNFFKDIGKESDKISSMEHLKKLRSDIFELQRDPSEKNVLGHDFDFIAWVNSKISGKSYANCLQDGLIHK